MIDFETIKAIYKIGRGLSMKDVQNLVQAANSKSFAPLDYLIQEGSHKKDVFFIRKGLVRAFSINDKGEEITVGLRWENQFVVSPDTILLNQTSRFYYQALEQTETLSLNYDLLQEIVEANPQLQKNRKFILQKTLADALERIESFVLYSPEERYIRFVETKPDIVNRVPGKYIANILGITPVSLSRIRKRIADRKK